MTVNVINEAVVRIRQGGIGRETHGFAAMKNLCESRVIGHDESPPEGFAAEPLHGTRYQYTVVAFEERDRVANVLQASLLPPTLPDIPGVDLGAAYQGGQTSVGGDFYDMFPLADDDWFIVLGDVCGKGPLAAARTAVARHSVRTGALLRRQPDAALRVMNQALLIDESADQRSRFVSVVALRIRFGTSGGGVLDVDAAVAQGATLASAGPRRGAVPRSRPTAAPTRAVAVRWQRTLPIGVGSPTQSRCTLNPGRDKGPARLLHHNS